MPAIEEILKTANEAGASDVHISVGIPPKMRVNGKLVSMNYARMLPADALDILLYIMTETQREKFEEKGEFDFSYSQQGFGRYRINAYKERGTVAMAIRLVPLTVKSSAELGIPEAVMSLCEKKSGMIFVAGPAGSGKTTTLAAIVDGINSSRETHIITLERPIEYLHQHKLSMVNQREIGVDSASYASAIKAALRENPDVILLGELLDFDTVQTALTAAETGHLVLAEIPAAGAVNAVDSIIDMFPLQQQQKAKKRLTNVLETVVFQKHTSTEGGSGMPVSFEVLQAKR